MEACPFEIVSSGDSKVKDPKILTRRLNLGSSNKLKDDAPKFNPSEDLRLAINTAISVGEPLLITGEPGTGKTQTAYYVADKLKLGKVLHFQTKSDSTARDLLYHFDTVGYFRDAQLAKTKQDQEKIDKAKYVEKRELYKAIASANETGLPCVLLIDEIDKAPRDFPNDLLHELDQMNFRIVELKETATNGKGKDDDAIWENEVKVKEPGLRPIVFITSNSERRLPEPFLRRCVYHHINFNQALLKRALETRRQDFEIAEELIDLAIDRFIALRRKDLRKKPATGEFLVWLKMLSIQASMDFDNLNRKLKDESRDHLENLPYIRSLLLKDHGDYDVVKNRAGH